jgi:hypothetical protein
MCDANVATIQIPFALVSFLRSGQAQDVLKRKGMDLPDHGRPERAGACME